MERRLRYTLLTHGSSDRSLIHIIDWSIEQQPGNWLPEGTWADRYRFADVGHDLAERAAFAWEQYPTDLLIIHRDAEKEEAAVRRAEIERAMQVHPNIPHLPLVIKPMLEAWLLGDEQRPYELPQAILMERASSPCQGQRNGSLCQTLSIYWKNKSR